MEKEFLKIGSFYEVTYPNEEVVYVKVLDIFPNNFIKVFRRRTYSDSKSLFDLGYAVKVFINLAQVESLLEIKLRG